MSIAFSSSILYLDPADFLGGAEFFSLDLLPLLANRFQITVLTNSIDSSYAQKLPQNVQIESFPFPRLKPLTFRSFGDFFRTIKRLREFLKERKFDLIHTNSIRAHIIVSQALRIFPENERPKLCFFVHDFTFPRWAVRLFSGKADRIMACSEVVKKDLMHKGISEEKITIIPNGVEIERFAQIEQKTFDPQQPVIGMLGRIDRWKGQDVFLRAIPEVLKIIPEAQFKIFGESSVHDPKTGKFEAELHEFVRANDLGQNVEFCGFQSIETVFSSIDLLVHASTASEPFGRVIIEALAAGIPVIASNLGGPVEILREGVNGFLIAPNDPALLARKITELCTSEDLRRDFTENGRKLVRSKFSLSKIAEKIAGEWKQLLEMKNTA